MIRFTLGFGIAIVLLSGPWAGAAIDRPAEHARLLSGLDLTHRGTAVGVESPGALSTAADEDIRISQSVSPARFSQEESRVLNTSGGGWWVVWTDDREGSSKIYRQRYDSTGSLQGSNEMIAGSSIGHDYSDPRLALDTLNRVYLSWRDQSAGMLFVARYTSVGAQDWSPILVNDTSGSSFAGPFDMAVFPDGQVVIVWEDYSALGSTIQFEILSSTGAVVVGPTQVNSDGGSSGHWVPAVAVAPGSGFLVCWEDYRNDQADIYARQYTGAGSAVATDFAVVPSPDDTAAQYAPCVTYSSKDRYVIAWTDLRQGEEIFLQRYNQITGLVGSGQQVSAGLELVQNGDVDLSTNASGRTHVLWAASGADNSIQSLMLDSGLAPSGLPAVINLASLGQRWAPSAKFSSTGAYAVAWTESTDDAPDIALMLFTASGNRRLANELTVNDDALGAHVTAPAIVTASNWWNVVSYVSRRADDGDIYVRTISHAGDYLGPEEKINQDDGSNLQVEPSLSATSSRIFVVWNDMRTLAGLSGQRIFGRQLNTYGVPVAREILISDSTSLASKFSPRMVLRSDGSGLAVWLDSRGGQAQVYGHWLSTSGVPQNSDFLISSLAQSTTVTRLFTGCDNSDKISIVWFDAGAAIPTLHVQRFNANGTDAGSFVYAPSTPAEIENISADIGSDGRVALLWTGYDDGDHNVYVTLLSAAGAILNGPVTINDSNTADPGSPAVSICNNLYISTVWLDRRDGHPLVYYQILDPTLTLQGTNQPAAASTPEFMQEPATDAYRGRAWFVWSDPRTEGLNVYGRSLVYLPTDVDDNPSILPSEFRLAQNYPNPFNPSTEIEYSLPTASRVQLIVFNVLGQTTRVLVDHEEAAGTHQVVWDGRDDYGSSVASGVYFYRLTVDDHAATRKMMLLK
jgi:hypothetical protein